MPTPALSASFLTVCTSQYWVVPSEPSITCAPVDHLAMVFDSSSERIEPPNPITAENRSSVVTSIPSAISQRSSPSRLTTTERTSRTAMLVARNRTIRFMNLFSLVGRLDGGSRIWFQDRPGTLLGDHVGRRVGVSRGDARKDRGVDHPQARDAVHAQLVVHHRHRVAAHFAGADGMEDGGAELAGGFLQVRIRLGASPGPVFLRQIFFQGSLR